MTAPGGAPHGMVRGGVLERARRGAAWVRWYVAELNGEHAYGRYVEHAEASGRPVLSRQEFERDRLDRRGRDPREGGRCC
ncbi:CstA-like transporter-associated (seleno)protein [Streptomyces sp. AD55]|uniref:CstA-like transporter-associated (seleno)protein n=1 Tax=Streptomyces sp. AD55 TaxID=3242895 RepID=UPI003527015B